MTAPASRDERYMREAIVLAQRGRGSVEPNPRVGAIALQAGQIVGRGWHRVWGGPHAEAEALADARAAGAVPDEMVVTLEPCSTGPGQAGKRQPPCVDTLLAAGIRRVVIGAIDPDPRHSGTAQQMLSDAGVEVVCGVASEPCRSINQPFVRWLGLDRPWTIAKWAMSIDGKIASQRRTAQWLSNVESRRRVHELRGQVDAVVVGFRTAVADDPALTLRDAPGQQPIRIVIDPQAEIPRGGQLVRTAREHPTWIVVGEGVDQARVAGIESLGVSVLTAPLVTPPHALDLAEAWRSLRRDHGLRRVLVEGGGGLFAGLWSVDCIDQVVSHIAPVALGGATAPTPFDGIGFDAADGAPRFGEMWCEAADPAAESFVDDLRLHAIRH